MNYTLGTAAKAAGKSKTSIRRALDSGKISGKKNDFGEWEIDPSELHRVFPVSHSNSDADPEMARSVTSDGSPIGELKAKLESAEIRIRDKDAVIDDLRQRLDMESEERRKLTALLTDKSTDKPPQEARGGRLSRAWSILTGKS